MVWEICGVVKFAIGANAPFCARGLGAGCELRGREGVDAGKEKGTLVAGDAGPVARGLGSLVEDLASFY